MKIVTVKENINGFPFIAYIPDHCSEHPALLMQLHGAGERGDGQDVKKVLVHGFAHVVNDDNLKDCILVMPQCPADSFWVAKIESLKAFIDGLMEEYAIDPNRVYLCGLSMGGFGTWYTAMAYPELFAAIAPCCGGGMAWNAGVLKMPIRTFHGLEDPVVSPHQTIEMIEALKGWHPDFEYELYEGVGHDSWDNAFSPRLLEWLLSQTKQ
ncbi:MAG: dienelactone hydrolase family protein [Clostridia bacterium]|nr:dienelactone hydrolase family protein [Clostridia bacterium]